MIMRIACILTEISTMRIPYMIDVSRRALSEDSTCNADRPRIILTVLNIAALLRSDSEINMTALAYVISVEVLC